MGIVLHMATSKSLGHALHNEEVCKHLNRTPKYLDWVITTAYYSALHFATHKLFPFELEVNGKKETIKSLDDYCSITRDSTRKHNKLAKLIEERHEDIADVYCQMRDISWTARYQDYAYDRDISSLAVKRLSAVKEYCVGAKEEEVPNVSLAEEDERRGKAVGKVPEPSEIKIMKEAKRS
jgi:hypothetical protein